MYEWTMAVWGESQRKVNSHPAIALVMSITVLICLHQTLIPKPTHHCNLNQLN